MKHIPSHSRSLLALSLSLALASTAQAQSAPRFSVLQSATPGQSKVYDGLIVTYRDGSSERRDAGAAANRLKQIMAAPSTASTWSSTYRQSAPALSRVRRLAIGADLVRPNRALSQSQLETLMTSLRADPAVAHVEPNLILKPVRSTVQATASAVAAPNDPGYVVQWHLRTPDGHLETLAPETTSYANRGGIDLLPAWQYGTGQGVVVAVIDTGITAHPDLDTSLASAGYDFISDALMSGRASNGRVPGGWDTGDWTTDDKYLTANGGCAQPDEQSDSSWHGTHVAGTIAMRTNNGLGMAGIAPDARILPIRALGHCGGSTADIADAIVWASGGHVDGVPDNPNPAEVINMSLGSGAPDTCPQLYQDAIDQINAKGTIIVVAAGNSNANAATYTMSSCNGVISVGASRVNGGRASYSNYGSRVDIAAPGGGGDVDGNPNGYIFQVLNGGAQGPTSDWQIGGMAGTSMASPHVAAAVAMVQSIATTPFTWSGMRDLLRASARPFPVAISSTTPIGAGILDIDMLLQMATTPPCAPSDSTCVPPTKTLTNKVEMSGLSSQGGDALYSFQAEAGKAVSFMTFGGSGSVALYAAAGKVPTSSSYDSRSVRAGTTTQTIRITPSSAGTYYLRLSGSYSGLTLVVRQ